MRPAPDVMSQLSALLPVRKGSPCYAALKREADRLRAAGDPRVAGQIMADTLVARVTAATPSAAGGSLVVPVAVNLVMSQGSLLAGADDPAYLEGHGWIPADLARALVAESVEAGVKTWLRRLFTRPGTGDLVAMDARSRLGPGHAGPVRRTAGPRPAGPGGVTHRSGTATT